MFKIATWNVNSLRVRLPHVLEWLSQNQPDLLALQETKILDEDFPVDELAKAGYDSLFSGQKSYNGVAILSKKKYRDKLTDFPTFSDPQRRILGVTVDDVHILNLYIPNGQSLVSEKYTYKMNWLSHLDLYLKKATQIHSKVVVLGDFNIAPEERDIYDPKAFENTILFTEKERDAFQNMLNYGFVDCFRLHSQEANVYSWWDYRMNGFKRNLGARIDHIIATPGLFQTCIQCEIDKTPRGWERPSDHAPVMAHFEVA